MKRLFIIDCYPSDDKDIEILNQCIESIKPLGYHILIVSHLHIPQKTTKLVEYVIYDSNNTFLDAHYTPFWWMYMNDLKIQINNAGHTLPICRNMNTSIHMAKCLGYEDFIFMESDIIFNIKDLNTLKSYLDDAFVAQNKQMLFFRPEEYRDCEGSYVYETLLFAGKSSFFLDTFVPPLDQEQWLSIPMGYTLELSFYERFSHKEDEFYLIKDHSSNIFDSSQVNLSRYGLFNCEVVYNEIIPDEPVFFVMNSLIENQPKDVEIYIDGALHKTMTLYKSQYWFDSYRFNNSVIDVLVYDNASEKRLFMKKQFVMSKSNMDIFKDKGTIKSK